MESFEFEEGLDFAQRLDAQDRLAVYRQEFVFDDPDLLYMDGNSLGRLPRRTAQHSGEIIREEWGQNLIRSWGEGWFEAPLRIGDKIGRLIGAASGQVVVSDSTSINLFKLAMAALDLNQGRKHIISDVFNFPSDLYILQGCGRLLGSRHSLTLAPSPDGVKIDLDKLYESIGEDTALVTLSHVAFKSGYLYDAREISERAHRFGAFVLWDLSHSAGVVPISLDDWGVDFAIGCTYKYLNGGPGSPAYLYVRRGLQARALSPVWGWFGQQAPFAFDLDYKPAGGVARFQCGTPPILSLLAMEQGVDLILEAGIERIRAKSVGLTSYLIFLFDRFLAPLGFSLGTPRQEGQRGSHASIRHEDGYRINRALIEEMDVIPDFREPDNIRLGLAPLYTSFSDVWKTIERIRQVILERRHLHYPKERKLIT